MPDGSERGREAPERDPDASGRRLPVADRIQDADVQLERDGFMRTLLRHLSGTLEDVVGMEEAIGFVSVVGSRMGEEIDRMYRSALGAEEEGLSREQVSEVLVDLKRRIEGDFYIIEQDDEKIVLGNRACPFGEDRVKDRPSLCMMTSNVFGVIAARNLGYAKVDVEEAIARGHDGCRIVVHLQPTEAADASEGREYFSELGG